MPRGSRHAPPRTSAEQQLVNAYRTILRAIGEDPSREGLIDTPARAAKAMLSMTSGYNEDPRTIAGGALFRTGEAQSATSCAPGVVLVRDIKVHSLCEHHLLPFFGMVHIGYLPGNNAVLGLSKLARIAEAIARRLQMQERLTQQIADALMEVAEARGVYVVAECAHMCMCSRGVKQQGTQTLTAAARGAFVSDAGLRSEFHALLGRSPSADAMQPTASRL